MTYPPTPSQPDPTRTFNPPSQQYPPHTYGQPQVYGQPTYPVQPPPRRSRSLMWASVALALAVVFAGSGITYAYNKGLIFKDSGIKACEALRQGNRTFTGAAQNDTPMTEQQYKDLRKVFADSRFDDIRSHGTKLMDLVWQISQLTDSKDPESGFALLPYVGPLTSEVSGLQSACADQGIMFTIPIGK